MHLTRTRSRARSTREVADGRESLRDGVRQTPNTAACTATAKARPPSGSFATHANPLEAAVFVGEDVPSRTIHISSWTKANHAKESKGYCKEPRARLARTTETDRRNRVLRLFLVIAERIKRMSRAGVPPAQVPQNTCYPCGESEHT